MTDDRKARVTREMELLGPEAMTRSLRAFPRVELLRRWPSPCACVLGYAGLTNDNAGPLGFYKSYTAVKRKLGGDVFYRSALADEYEAGDPDQLHAWILEWLELNRVAAPAPVAAPVPPIAADCPRCCQVEYGITRHCADHCLEGMPF